MQLSSCAEHTVSHQAPTLKANSDLLSDQTPAHMQGAGPYGVRLDELYRLCKTRLFVTARVRLDFLATKETELN